MISLFIYRIKLCLYRGNYFSILRKARNYETLSHKKKEMENLSQRKKLLIYAYENCPFYKTYYDNHGFTPNMVKYEKDWDKVPILEKEMIRNHYTEIVSRKYNISQLHTSTTGGSTGTPLKLYKEKKRSVIDNVLKERALSWWNLLPVDNIGVVHRKVPQNRLIRMWHFIAWWPLRKIYLDASSMSPVDIDIFLKRIKKKGVKIISGYCGSLEHIADYVLRNQIKGITLKAIWSTSSPLTITVRNKLEKAFHCQVMDQYGCCEIGNIAVQKPNEDCLTINSDYVHVDIVDNQGHLLSNMEKGDILITDLYSNAFPLIKYRLGDKGKILMSYKDSNDGFPKMDFVSGRISDAIILPNGTIIDGSFLTTICDNYVDLIDSYQIYQSLDYSLKWKVVLKDSKKENDPQINEIYNVLIQKTQNSIPITIDFQTEILSHRGKRQFIISEIYLNSQKH